MSCWSCTNKGNIKLSQEEVVNAMLHIENGLVVLEGASGEAIVNELALKSKNRRTIQISALGAVDALVEALYEYGSLGDAQLISRAVEQDIYCITNIDVLQSMVTSKHILSTIIGSLKYEHLVILCGNNLNRHFDDLLLLMSFYEKYYYLEEKHIIRKGEDHD